jgi:hypothetical protein
MHFADRLSSKVNREVQDQKLEVVLFRISFS